MSGGIEQADEVCASCGKAAIDNITLKICTACKLVKYCSVDCQKNHRPQHKKACKKRMAEIRDDRLFTQPDGCCFGECPICCLPLSIDFEKSTINACCCQLICKGCWHVNLSREAAEGLEHKCAYCREPVPKTKEELQKNLMKRVEANDPNALCFIGKDCQELGDYERAFEYFTKATELGDVAAHYELSHMYYEGEGVEKDPKKEVYHLEEAAIAGHPDARNNLGCYENENGRIHRAMRHFIIAAKLGHDHAMDGVKEGFAKGFVSKEDFEASLRGHQAAVDAMKSEQREEAYAIYPHPNTLRGEESRR